MNSSSSSAPSASSTPSSANSRRSKRANAPGARTDVGWEHAIDLGQRRVKCKFCSCELTGGIYRFKHHLARTHKDASACEKVPEDVKVKFQKVLEQMELAASKKRKLFSVEEDEELLERDTDTYVSKKGKVQNTLNKIYKKDERDKVCQQIARFFYTSALSFNCVKNPEFSKMIKMIGDYGRGLDPPSYHEMRVTYLKKEVDYTKAILEDYKNEWKKTGCTLMSDGWSDRKNRSICNFLVNSPKGTIFLASIDTSEISKTKEKVFAMLDDFVEKIGEEHVVQVVTDNAANYKSAGEMLMQKATEEIKSNYKGVQARYEPIMKIVDERWDNQLNRPLHVAGYFLNPRMQYSSDFKGDTPTLKANLYTCITKMAGNEALANEIDYQLDLFKKKKGHLFNLNIARLGVDKKSPVDWWDSFGDDTPELKRFAMRVLSLTCSSSGCERNWSAFEMVHSKRRNCLHQQKMNDLVFVMYNLKISQRQERKMKETTAAIKQLESLEFEDVESDDEWITEEESSQSQANDGGGDNDFLERAIRGQFGRDDEFEEPDFVLHDENEVDAHLHIID